MTRHKKTPSYRLHKATGQAVITLDGQDHYLGNYGTDASREAYDRTVVSWRSGNLAQRAKGTVLSVAALVARFLANAKAEGRYIKNGKPTSEINCLRVALRPLVKLYGTMPVGDFTVKNLKLVRVALCERRPPAADGEPWRRHHSGLRCRESVNLDVHRIRRVFRWAEEEELVPEGRWHSLRSLRPLGAGSAMVRESDGVKPVPLRSLAMFLRHCKPREAVLVRFQWLTGARPGEAVQLRMRDIDRSGSVWIYTPMSHKTEHRGKTRTILIGPRAQRVLAPHIQLDPDAWLFSGHVGHLRENSYSTIVRKVCIDNGIAPWAPNQIRHNTLTNARRSHGIDTASVVAGHSNVATTEIYAEQDVRKAMEWARAHG
jgi:integrase